MIVVRYKDVMSNQKLCFYSKSGIIIEENKISSKDQDYVVLAAIYRDLKLSDPNYSFSDAELSLANKFFYNQIKGNQEDYHFKMSGIIHSFRYGAMYHANAQTGHTIGKFSTSK